MKKNKKPEERKKEIIETSKRLFIEKGYEATQIKDIVSEIRVAQGLFYYYFKSKREVFEIIADEYTDNIIVMVERLCMSKVPAKDKLFGVFSIFLKSAEKESKLFTEILTADGGIIHDKLYNSLGKKMIPIIMNVVDKANISGEFQCKYPLQTTQIMVHGVLALLKEIPSDEKIDFVKNNLSEIEYIIKDIYNIGG